MSAELYHLNLLDIMQGKARFCNQNAKKTTFDINERLLWDKLERDIIDFIRLLQDKSYS